MDPHLLLWSEQMMQGMLRSLPGGWVRYGPKQEVQLIGLGT